MLERVLRIEYSWELEQVTRAQVAAQVEAEFAAEALAAKDELIASLRSQLSNWVGRVAEVFIERFMKRFFQGQTVDGEVYFNTSDMVRLSHFSRVFSTFALPPGATQTYQVDLYAEPQTEDDLPWVVEVKNWTRPVGRPEVERFLAAVAHLIDDRGHDKVVSWFYARSGFSEPAETLLQESGVLYTDQNGLVQLLEDLQVVDQW